jgi:hypothetical protein
MREKPIEAVIDSVTLNSAFQPPKRSHKSPRTKRKAVNPLEKPISDRRLRLALDEDLGLRSEWEKTCGRRAVKDFMIYCEQFNGIQLIKTLVSPASSASKKLKLMGFGHNTVDKLILRIALATQNPIIVSDDSDFWDPTKPNDRRVRGDKNAPVARFCRTELGVTILLLKMLLAKFA